MNDPVAMRHAFMIVSLYALAFALTSSLFMLASRTVDRNALAVLPNSAEHGMDDCAQVTDCMQMLMLTHVEK